MNRCSETVSVVAAMFERGSLDPQSQAHVNACATCGAVLAAQRRFEVELGRAAAALTLEAMAPDLASEEPLQSGGQPMRRSHMALMAAGFVAVVAAVMVASPWIATTLSSLAPNAPTVGGPPIDLPDVGGDDADDRRGVHQELILDITNNRDAAVVLRIVPQILEGVGLPAPEDAGVGDGSPRVEPQARQTLRLSITSEPWTLTMNGTPFLRSTDHEFIPGGWTAARIVVDPEEVTSEIGPSEPAPSN